MVIPPFVGSRPTTLNLYVALVGASGTGKGATTGAAATLIPNLHGAIETQPASGEGIAAMFAGRRYVDDPQDEKKKVSELYCISSRALLNIPEIRTLGGTMNRTGNIIAPTLTSAYSGEPLGAWNKQEENRLLAPAYGYSLSLITGVQPANSDILTKETGTGLPQRFLWAYVTDQEAPDSRPLPPNGPIPLDLDAWPRDPERDSLDFLYLVRDRSNMLDPDKRYPLTMLHYPDAVWNIIDADRLDILHGKPLDPLDAHKSIVTTKIAGLLALTEGSTNVDMDDWLSAEQIVAESIRNRRKCLEEGAASQRNDMAESMRLKDDAREQADTLLRQRTRKRILDYLTKHDPNKGGIPDYKLRHVLSNPQRHVYRDVIDEMNEKNEITKISDDGVIYYSLCW
ncbi:hypothetical protein EP30_02400 [Bifidobacterium sp. UTCIF-39]|uniref:hypothetical protein n=1 Tax=Bifidobacterium sp. UTCIF-39 TaxID=1465359 RepID=UPI001126D3EE|nr:hypothetical protein [Bifidobacterium sp. UTCIF-39]TPF97462.1 hypothetical protein EP30_02400 [Bifidobacterium sp. UTCIF-39]